MCSICQDSVLNGDLIALGCGHAFHRNCAQQLFEVGDPT